MSRKYLISIVGLISGFALVSSGLAEAASNNTWLIKSKTLSTDSVFAVWMDGHISQGEPSSSDSSSLSSGPTETLRGDQYISASRWFNVDNGAVRTFWARKPITYAMESSGGEYRISLTAKNYPGTTGWVLPQGYKNFKVDVYVEDKKKGRINIEASDTELKTSFLTVTNIKEGVNKVKLVWRNDKWNPRRKWDANIEIHNIVFEKVNP